MKSKLYVILFCLFLSCLTNSSANDTAATYTVEPLPSNLINFSSPKGQKLLKKNADSTTFNLLSHFTTQKTTTYCGVASTVMVLNASNLTKPLDPNHKPYHYFTQDDFFNDKVSNIISRDDVLASGIPLSTLDEIIHSFGLSTQKYYSTELSLRSFRKILQEAITNQQFVIVNFHRKGLHQAGSGHHSPLAAFDKKTDRFLLLDVARYKYPAYWVTTEDLYRATKTLDEGTSRGFVIIKQ